MTKFVITTKEINKAFINYLSNEYNLLKMIIENKEEEEKEEIIGYEAIHNMQEAQMNEYGVVSYCSSVLCGLNYYTVIANIVFAGIDINQTIKEQLLNGLSEEDFIKEIINSQGHAISFLEEIEAFDKHVSFSEEFNFKDLIIDDKIRYPETGALLK